MNSTRKTTIQIWASLILLSAFLAFLWRPLDIAVRSARGADDFFENFHASRTLNTEMHPDDWAIFHFMGTAGLERLESLKSESSLSPHGRSLASNIYHRISTGQHLPVLKKYATDQILDRPYRDRCAYIYSKDKAWLELNSPQPMSGAVADKLRSTDGRSAGATGESE